MENDSDSIENSKNVFEGQSLILNLNENIKKIPNHQTADVDNQPNLIYKDAIKLSVAVPQVNICILYTQYVCECEYIFVND